MPTFWRKSGTNKIVVSAAGKPIDCPDCPCDAPLEVVCCSGGEMPYFIPFLLTQTGGTACAALDGLEGTLESTGASTGITHYSQDNYTLDAGIYGTTTFRFYLRCDGSNWHFGSEHVSGDVEYVGEIALGVCCLPFVGVVDGSDFPNASIDSEIECYDATFGVTVGPRTLYVTLSGATGSNSWINGVYPLDWNGDHWIWEGGVDGWVTLDFYCSSIFPFISSGLLGIISDNPVTVGRSCSFQSTPVSPWENLTITNEYPFLANGTAEIENNGAFSCDAVGESLTVVVQQ